jgi:atypical dual specificity phosphatase
VENFGWLIEGQLAGSGGLIHHEELVWLREQGVGAIASLTERSLRREKLLLHRIEPLGFTYRHIPVIDETAPSQAQVDEFIGFVDESQALGRAVLAHCRGGYGRTGTRRPTGHRQVEVGLTDKAQQTALTPETPSATATIKSSPEQSLR